MNRQKVAKKRAARKPGRPPSDNPKTTKLSGVRLTADELGFLQKAAVADAPDKPFAQWVRDTLFTRAKRAVAS